MSKIESFLKSFYEVTMIVSARKDAIVYLAIFSFIESSFFPIPPYVMIVPMVLARPDQAWKIAGVATVSSVLGGYLGYAIGYFMFDVVALPILSFYGYMDQFESIKTSFNDFGSGLILIGGLTPVPFKITAMLCGLFKLNLFEFGFVSLIARAIRFYLVAWLLLKYGEEMRGYVARNLQKISLAFVFLIVLTIALFPYL
ncbi:MAG: DedA family protein [Alphaproteobacteria bacterium]|nr:DedA family protein [Alphaproteobacteria bacterium]